MSRHATELCTVLVNDIYGELTSGVFKELICYGRLSFLSLLHHTQLTPRQLKHGLVVLIQQHLVLWFTSEDNITFYEADLVASYALVRSGKYIKITEDRFGEFAGRVISNLLLLGHARIGDLAKACKADHRYGIKKIEEATHVLPNKSSAETTEPNPGVHASTTQEPLIDSLHLTLCDLLQSGLVTTVHESHFRSDEDNRSEAEKEQPRPEKWTGRLKAEHQIEWERTIQQKLQDWKYGTKLDKDEIASLRRGTKRPLEDSESDREIKRLRLCLPVTTLKVSTTEFGNEPRVSGAGNLNENLVLRINHEKFNVVMRNAKLTDLAENCIGTSTSRVYAEVLRKLDPSLRRCKSLTGSLEEDDETDLVELPQVSTHELATLFKDAAYFIDTIGQVDPDQINLALIDHPKKLRKKNSTNDLAKGVPAVDDVSSDEDSDNESDCSASSFSFDADSLPSSFSINESKSQPTALPFDSQDVRAFFSTIHQHLLLLYDHPNRFLRRVPKTSSVPEKWAVDFGALRATLVDVTLSQILSSRFGPLATRLASILKSSGKLDEKTLSTLSLINQKTMRALLTAMYRSGLLQLQEIPREGNRQPSRTLYLWDWEPERAKQTVLEDCYAAMGRLVRRLGVERERVKGVVDKAARSDVMGREAEFLSGPEMKALEGWRSTEQKLWGELDRLDDCVAVVRDF